MSIFEGACPNCGWFLDKFFRLSNTWVHPGHISYYSSEVFVGWRPWQRPGWTPLIPALSPKVINFLCSKAQTDSDAHQASYITISIGRYFPGCKATSGVACKNQWSFIPFPPQAFMACTTTRRIILRNVDSWRNVEVRLPNDAASYLRRAESLGTPLKRLQKFAYIDFFGG